MSLQRLVCRNYLWTAWTLMNLQTPRLSAVEHMYRKRSDRMTWILKTGSGRIIKAGVYVGACCFVCLLFVHITKWTCRSYIKYKYRTSVWSYSLCASDALAIFWWQFCDVFDDQGLINWLYFVIDDENFNWTTEQFYHSAWNLVDCIPLPQLANHSLLST